MLKQLLHLDSIDGIQNYDTILKSYHCYNTNILINKPISNIKEISLKSIEMPLFFNNIRTSNNSNIFSFNFSCSSLGFNNISIGCTIPELNYTSINSLLAALNNSVSTALSSYTGVSLFFNSDTTYYITITHNCSSLTLNKNILTNNILGFNSKTYNTSTITTTNFYCLNIDNYINLYITNLNSGSDTNANGRLLTFKIILPQTNGNILFLGESNTFIQTISITDPYFVLNSLNIMILDRFGYPINGGNANFSFTLGINYDKQNERLKYR
jgi:hypothetical protein